MSKLHVFEIDGGGIDWVVAESEDEAIRLLAREVGCPAHEYENAKCKQLPDDKVFTIMKDPYNDCTGVTKTCAEWATENGKGFLASTEF